MERKGMHRMIPENFKIPRFLPIYESLLLQKLAEEEEAKKAPETSKNFKDEFYVNPEDDIEEWSPGK